MSIWIYRTWASTIPEPPPVPSESIAPRFLSQLLEDLESKDETVNSLCDSSMVTFQAFSGECELEEENEALKRQLVLQRIHSAQVYPQADPNCSLPSIIIFIKLARCTKLYILLPFSLLIQFRLHCFFCEIDNGYIASHSPWILLLLKLFTDSKCRTWSGHSKNVLVLQL